MERQFGRYRLLDRLGEGGMAEVWRAKSFGVEGFEKLLVIKRILPELAAQPRFVDMFVHEAKLAVRLSHANIVQVFDLGRVDHPASLPPGATAGAPRLAAPPASYFIAMEYVPGLDLATLLGRCRRQKIALPFGMAVFLCAEIAKALDHAHRRRDEHARPLGIVHRDISPQNVLLSWEGEVKVTDFGIAKARSFAVETPAPQEGNDAADEGRGRVRGKLAYMSPEQAGGRELDGRSDIFSLGTVFYEMLSGTNPFSAPTAFETQRRVQASEYPPLELLRPDIDRALIELAAKMLAKDPDDRFVDAGKLHEQLLAWFYASNERFGPTRLAEFLERFQEASTPPGALGPEWTMGGSPPNPGARGAHEIKGGVFDEQQAAANERTPVEAQSAAPVSVVRSATGTQRSSFTGERILTGPFPRATEIGERRDVTGLVLSFLGADRARDDRDDAAVVIDGARAAIDRYGAVVVEEDASQLVALFGLGDADGRDTEAAVRAGLAALRARGGAVVSAGIHVARILVDAHGQPVRDERLATLTSTAQALARVVDGKVALTRSAARVVRTAFAMDDLPGAAPRSATGASLAASLPSSGSAIEGARVVTSAWQPSAGYGRFVGRHDELKRLGDILAQATRRRAQLVAIQGEKGVGKTRILAEMERRLARGSYSVGFYTATCPRNGAELPWSGLGAMLRVLCGVQEGDDEARILDVVPRLRALGLDEDERAAVLAELGAMGRSGHAVQEAGAALRSAFARMVQRLCDDRLHCFCWDGAEAMDRATLDAILAVLARANDRGGEGASAASTGSAVPLAWTGGLRAVFVFATRAGPPAALADHASLHQVTLGELSEDDAARLIAARAGARTIPPDLLAFCRERAGGHPLFLEELLKELIDSGSLTIEGGEAKPKLDGDSVVPRTLRALIAARTARLDPLERTILQGAAILGEPVPTKALGALLHQDDADTDRGVAALLARGLLRVTGPVSAMGAAPAYAGHVRFASPIHAEIVLDAIPPELRRELHAAAAEATRAALGDGAEHAERVGDHLREAGDRDRAASCFAEAALHRMRQGQIETAIRLLCRALELAELDQRAPAELAGWLASLADAVSRVRSAPDPVGTTTRVLRRLDAAGTRAERVLGRIDAATALAAVNLFDEAYERIEEAFALAGDDAGLRLRALATELECASRRGDIARAARAADALGAAGPMDRPRTMIAAAYVRAASGDCVAAHRLLDEAEAIVPPEDLMAAVERERQRVLVHIFARSHELAVEASARAIELARTAGVRFAVAVALHNLGDASRRLGDLPRAYAALSESRDVAMAAGQERLAALNRVHLAYLDALRGSAGAEAALRTGMRQAADRGYVTDALEGRFLLGSLLRTQGTVDEARRELEAVLARAESCGHKPIADDARDELARL